MSELVVDPMKKYFDATLDSMWAKGSRQGLRVIPDGYAKTRDIANPKVRLLAPKLGIEPKC